MKICNRCTIEFIVTKKNQRYCTDDCRRKGKSERAKIRYFENRIENRKKSQLYYQNNKEKKKEYNKKNREKIRIWKRKNNKWRWQNDKLYRWRRMYRCRIYLYLFGHRYTKNSNTYKMICKTQEEFRDYLTSLFNENMSWENYGSYWEIDHIVPLKTGTTESEIWDLCHYSNLRPLEKERNRCNKFN